ncbi:hypothetical protein IV454_17130 [Massilia antarctica]|uniref:DUF1566 domain-containing protein n=1 Tax=Massilia antarctica TaxID=2765360 RepID=A0AA49A5F8_9BURK|nr:hypothetical protein [Massilia antarctica]QPI47341.1 hypothetical protein IV454_17130 [Massilia antarctica]
MAGIIAAPAAQPLNGMAAYAALDPEGVTEMGANFGNCADAWAPDKYGRSTWMNTYAPTYALSSATSRAAPAGAQPVMIINRISLRRTPP